MLVVHFQASLFGEFDQGCFALFGEPRGGTHFGKQMLYRRDRVNDATTMETSDGMCRELDDILNACVDASMFEVRGASVHKGKQSGNTR